MTHRARSRRSLRARQGTKPLFEPTGAVLHLGYRSPELGPRVVGTAGLEISRMRLDHPRRAPRTRRRRRTEGNGPGATRRSPAGRRPRCESARSRVLPTHGLAREGDELDLRLAKHALIRLLASSKARARVRRTAPPRACLCRRRTCGAHGSRATSVQDSVHPLAFIPTAPRRKDEPGSVEGEGLP